MERQHPETIGPYRLLEPLGRGGMGVVWRAEHLHTGALAALKTVSVPNETMLQSLRREIRCLARLSHPGIVSILEEGLHQGLPWYAMELLESTPLHRYWSEKAGSKARVAAARPGPGSEPGAARPMPPEEQPRSAGMAEVPEDRTRPAPGQPVRDPLARRSPRQPTGVRPLAAAGQLDLALGLVHRLCAPLGYLHGEGLVHRDLKPQNILVRPDGSVVLIDLGLLAAFSGELSRDALDLEMLGAGTAAYMAPEQIRGETCDARADLYSLGCIVFELLAGRRPFAGQSDAELRSAHLASPPAAPSRFVEGVPPALDKLVLRLLAKDPRQRLGYADDVAAALEELGVPAQPRIGPQSRSYLYRPGFLGREREMALLKTHLDRLCSGPQAEGASSSAPEQGRPARAGAGSIVFVGGQSGRGKTRLGLELAREAAKQGIELLTGECLPPEQQGGSAALGPLRRPLQQLADRCRERGLAETRQIFGARGRLLADYEPALSTLPGHQEYPAPAELPPEAARLRLYQALLEVLEAAIGAGQAGAAPLLLVLDDLQWADGLTLGFLEFLLRWPPLVEPQPDRPPLRLMLLGLYRTEEVGEPLHALLGSPHALRLELGPLDPAAVRAMIAQMLALPRPPAVFSRFVDRHAEGNPFFVAEYLRTAVAESLLWRDEAGRWQAAVGAQPSDEADRDWTARLEGLALPRSLREVVLRRLQGLPGPALGLAEAAAVLGREVDLQMLRCLVELEEPELEVSVQELLRRQVLEEQRPGRLRFVHDKLRELAYGQIRSERRPALHRAAAEALEAGSDSELLLAELGHHWQQADETARARTCYLAAARGAIQRHAHEEAERLYRAYLRLVEEPSPESVQARNELGERVLGLRGREDEALAEHEQALAEARGLGSADLEGESLRSVGMVHWRAGRMDEARELYEHAMQLVRKVGNLGAEASVLSCLAGLHQDQGRLDEAKRLCEQAIEIHRRIGDHKSEGRDLGNLALLHKAHGQAEEARALYQQALELHRQAGDQRSEAISLSNLAGVLQFEERTDEAQRLYEQALDLHRQIGNRRSEAIVLGHMAELYWAQENAAEAGPLYEQALELHRRVGNRRFEGVAIGGLAEVRQAQGRMDEAGRLYAQALELHRQVGNRRFEGIVLGQAAEFESIAGGDLADARSQAEEAGLILGGLDDKLELLKVLCCQGHIELAGGGSGREWLGRAGALAAEAGAGLQSEHGRAVAKLGRAVEAAEKGQRERLHAGRLLEDLPEGLRRWLSETLPSTAAAG